MTKNQKIALLCSSTSWGGLEMVMGRYTGWLLEMGYDVVLFLVKDSPLYNYAVSNELPFKTIRKHRKYYDFSAAKYLYRELEKEGRTKLLFRHVKDMSVAARVAYLSKRKIKPIYWQAMQLGIKKKNVLHSIRFNWIHLWCSPSKWLIDQAKEMTNINPEKLRVVPLGIDQNKFIDFKKSKKECQISSNITLEIPVVGMIGRLDEGKRQHLLLEVLIRLKDKFDFQVAFVGASTENEGGEYSNRLRQVVENHGLEDRVHFLPFMEEIESAYRVLDVFVMATPSETFGVTTVEAMTMGVPIVGASGGGTPYILKNGELGTIFKRDDSDDLALKLLYVLENMNQMKEIAAVASKHAQQLYSKENSCLELDKILSE